MLIGYGKALCCIACNSLRISGRYRCLVYGIDDLLRTFCSLLVDFQMIPCMSPFVIL